MKKKSILLTCIVAIMALAMFVGCDNAPVVPSFVVGGNITQTEDFLIGQKFDSSKFSVSVRYSDGTTKTLSDTSIVTLQGEGDSVKNNSVVEARLGLDYDNEEYVQTAGVAAYAITAIEVTGPETVTADMDESDFTVVATYLKGGAEKTMQLNSQEFDITGFDTITEDGTPIMVKATPNLTGNNTVTGSYNAVFSGRSTTLPEGAVIESIEAKFVKDFSVSMLNYGDEAPAIDGSRIEVTAKVAGEVDPYDIASSDVEFTWVDAAGLPLINYNFLDNSVSTLYVKAEYEGFEAQTGAVDVFPVTVTFDNVSFKAPEKIVAGGELPEVTGLRYKWTSNGKSGIIAEEDVKLVYAYTATADPVVEGSSPVVDELAAGNYLMAYPVYKGQASENGIYLGYVEAKEITVESVEFSMVEGWTAPAKQYYSTLPTVEGTDIEKYVVTLSDGTVQEFDGSNSAFSVAFYTAEGVALADAKKTADGDYDALADVDSILVGVTYGVETYYSEAIALTKPALVGLTAKVVPDGVAVGSSVQLSIIAWNNDGNVDKNYTAYGVLDADGAPAEIVLTSGKTAVDYKIYALDDFNVKGTVTIPAGIGYIEPVAGEIKLASTETEELAAVGTAINLDLVKKYFEVDTESFKAVVGSNTPDNPAITAVKLPAERTLVTGDNEVPVVISYVDITGKAVNQNATVTIVGTPYVTSLDAKPVLLYDGKEFKKFDQGTVYQINLFTISSESFKAVGDIVIGNPKVTCTGVFVDEAAGTVTGDMNSNYTFTFTYLNTAALTKSDKELSVTLGVYAE